MSYTFKIKAGKDNGKPLIIRNGKGEEVCLNAGESFEFKLLENSILPFEIQEHVHFVPE